MRPDQGDEEGHEVTVPAAGARLRALLVVAVSVLALLHAGAGRPAAAATGPAVDLTARVVSGIDVNTYTGVHLHATVVPASARGLISFYIDGVKLGTAAVVGGAADLASTVHVGDGVPATAVFEPAAGSGLTASTSRAVVVAVSAVPRLWLVDGTGRTVAERGRIVVGQRYRLMLSGFRYGSVVQVQMAATTLASPRIGASGTASVLVAVPTLRSGTYRVTATSGSRSTSAVYAVLRPATGPAPTASAGGNVSVVVPSATMPSTGGGDDDSDDDDDGDEDSDDGTSDGGTLARTGSEASGLLGLAAFALLTGTALLLVTRRGPRGRHSGVS